jgi:hypothetical protein
MLKREQVFEIDKGWDVISNQNYFSCLAKRSQSVIAKQRLHDTLSVTRINDITDPQNAGQNVGMINLVSDFHKSNTMRFKLLKDTLKFIDKKKLIDTNLRKLSPFKVRPEKHALSEIRIPKTLDHLSNKACDFEKLYDEVGNTNHSKMGKNKMKKLDILLKNDPIEGDTDKSRIENHTPVDRTDDESPVFGSAPNLQNSIYTDTAYKRNFKAPESIKPISTSIIINENKNGKVVVSSVTRKNKTHTKFDFSKFLSFKIYR